MMAHIDCRTGQRHTDRCSGGWMTIKGFRRPEVWRRGKKCRRRFRIVQIVTATLAYIIGLFVAHATTIYVRKATQEKRKPESIGRVGANAKNQESRITGAGEGY